ncbi:hypothetical protein BJY04DRAFT_219987 [Aspergillus karnatakaensis]|uniref:uncharacterized protein n=1 Tax=Aspergillus karnatakaensis TaxID=1810916 RepID=UPI003CCD1008
MYKYKYPSNRYTFASKLWRNAPVSPLVCRSARLQSPEMQTRCGILALLAKAEGRHKRLYLSLACKRASFELLKFDHWVETYNIQHRLFEMSLEQRLEYDEGVYDMIRERLLTLVWLLERAQVAAAGLVGVRGVFSRGRELEKCIRRIREFIFELRLWSEDFFYFYLGVSRGGLAEFDRSEEGCQETLAFIRLVF